MKTRLTYVLMTAIAVLVSSLQITNAQNEWLLAGNANASNASKLGTTNGTRLRLMTNNQARLIIHGNTGNIGIGTNVAPPADYKLQVTGDTYNGIYSSGNTYGIYGYSGSNYGVYGSSGYVGVYGTGTSYGLYGSSISYGVYGSGASYGVYGHSGSSFGVRGYSGYLGVYGTGDSYGVYGTSAGSSGYAGYFYSGIYRALYAETGSANFYSGVFSGGIGIYSSGGFTLTSDKNVKKNIQDVGDAMSIINKLQPKNFEFRNDGKYASLHLPKGSHYGLLAQDLEQVLPNLVNEMEQELNTTPPAEGKEATQSKEAAKKETMKIKGINYDELIPILIKAVQEQQKEIEDLKEVVTSLKANATISSSDVTTIHTSGAYLKQNVPNPASNSTIIEFYIPASSKQAQLIIYSQDGRALKSFSTSNSGTNQVTIHAGTFTPGQYVYALLVDGKKIESKSMILTN